ncbi:MAG: RNA polymerase sigma factor [Oscillospiraceae bacterium]|nr:RNA polymerase sigma factor [Oscillospiraceae bacterium]
MPKTALRTDADFEAFYDRHWKYVYRLCFTYMKNEADAEDCTEDVFVKVLKRQYAFDDETHERKWLTIAAINQCKDKLKSYERKNVVSLDDDDAPEPAAPEEEDYSEVTEAVMNLPPKLKDVIWLYYYEGYSTDEIASMLGRPPSTVRNQMRDARNLLKSVLGGDPR